MSSAYVALAVFAPGRAEAFVVKKTAGGSLVHWEQSSVDYTFDPSVAANVPQAIEAANEAMSSWSGTVGAPDLVGHHAADVKDAPTRPGFDEKNGFFFFPNGYAAAGKALAITVLTYDNASGRILDADIIVNGNYRFAVLSPDARPDEIIDVPAAARPSNTDGVTHEDGTGTVGSIYDLHHVFAHELGHSLGMNDEMANKGALMYRYTAANSAALRAPSPDDVEGLAQLYGTKLEGTGNGCQSSTVAAKKPTLAASQLAMVATLGFLIFLVLRGKSDRRARFAFVAAAAVAVYALLPSVSAPRSGIAQASEAAPGQARAKVIGTSVSMEDGLLKTTYQLATTACRAASCPKLGEGVAWGGTAGTLRQEVGSQLAPSVGDAVDVTFDARSTSLAAIATPLGGMHATAEKASVRVVTRAVD